MQVVRSTVKGIGVVLVVVTILIGGQFAPGALAQDGDQCVPLAAAAISAAKESCADLAPGEICYGHAGVTAEGATGFEASGDTVDVSAVRSLATAAADPASGEWGVALMMLPGEVPEGETQPVMAALFGDAQISRPAQEGASDRPTVTISNSRGEAINLRNGAGTFYDLVGTLEPGTSAVADGRNEQTDWLRIQMEDGTMAWVFVRLIDWEGDFEALQQLEVLLPDDVTPPVQAGEPFQSLTLITGDDDATCRAAPSGMLFQFDGEQPASLHINQVSLTSASATVLVRARANDVMEVLVLTGSATVTARGIPEEATAGSAAQVSLGGDGGLTPTTPPLVYSPYAFPEVAHAPVSLLPGEIDCMAGLPAADARVVMRVGPGDDRGELSNMSPDATYAVIGWADDPDGAPWWQLDTGETKSWVAQSAVSAIGACDAVAQAEPPPVIVAPPSGPPADDTGGADTGGDDFAPTSQTVWQMVVGTDNMSGECSGAPAINFCDHLAAISPAQGGLSWKGMEASPYYLARIAPNTYSYAGPNSLNTGTVTMTLSFTSATTVKMTMVLVLSSEPNCQHTYYYTGSLNW